jgi:putative Mg2+ transporter-C (MgtC) family protein
MLRARIDFTPGLCSPARMDIPLAGQVALNLGAAWGAGLLIGLERTFNGRAAGFRTHALVGLASAATVTIALQPMFVAYASGGQPLDPSRLAQGVMTGIGFLGAGVIFKEGVSVQGLTTAASIWITAAIGLLFGVGMFAPGLLITVVALLTLVVFRWVENRIPWRVYAIGVFRFDAAQAPDEKTLEALFARSAVSMSEMSYKLTREGRTFEYLTNLETRDRSGYEDLARQLRTIPGLVEYEVSRISK